MTETTSAASIHKVRRLGLGGKRGPGWEYQKEGRRIRRPDPRRVRLGRVDPTLSAAGGLVPFDAFLRDLGLGRRMARLFNRLKSPRGLVYPMSAQLQLLIDVAAAGEDRVFGLECLAADPVVQHLAGGAVPSIDTVYRDLRRFRNADIDALEAVMAEHGMAPLPGGRGHVHVDIDTTVEPLFGSQEGARPGPNPRYHGRPSYHPVLGVVAETGTCIGACLRPGDTGFGEADVAVVAKWLDRIRQHVGPKKLMTVRMDAAADCAAFLQMLNAAGCRFIVKLRATEAAVGALLAQRGWRTVEVDADGKPTCQVATLTFQRDSWLAVGGGFRVVAVRRNDRQSGNQLRLWDDNDLSTQVYVTSDWLALEEDIADEYNGRAEVEPIIGDLKHALGLGKMPSQDFDANHAAFLIKLLTHNLLRRYARRAATEIAHWRTPWLRRLLILRPGRLLRSGRRWTLRLAPSLLQLE
jgi:hypothetical protein